MIVVLRHTGFSSVREKTHFFGAFTMSPKGSPAGIGSNAWAWVTLVRWPRRNVSEQLMSSKNALPMSSCQ
jgi:hypothetical protein